MFNKDTFRLIKRTFKRFLSLFLIVMIGVAFMVGLMATSPILQSSVDAYDDETNLMDLQLYSSYGFCDEDIEALKATRGVEDAFGSKFIDVYAQEKNNKEYVVRMQEIDSNINKFVLKDGRMPESKHEALILRPGAVGGLFKIGDNVKVYLDTENALRNNLKYQNYTIVGTVDTPQYMSLTSETSTLANQELDTVLFVNNDNFKADYYTSIYLTLDDAKASLAFSNEYVDVVNRATKSVERTKESQGNFLKSEIMADIKAQIAEGENTLASEKAKGEEELSKAQKQLDDAYVQILVGESQIKASESQIQSGEKAISTNQAILDENAKIVNAGIAKVEESTGMSYLEAYDKMTTTYNIYQTLKAQQDNESQNIQKIKDEITKNEEQIKVLNADIAALNQQKNEIIDDQEALNKINAEIADKETEIQKLEAKNVILQKAISEIDKNNIQKILDEMDKQAGGSVTKSYAELKQLVEGKAKLDAGYAELNKAKQELESGKAQLNSAKKELQDGRNKYEAGVADLANARYTFNKEIEEAESEIALAYQKLDELPAAEWMILNRDAHFSSYMFKNTIDQMHSIGMIFPLLFFLVAALVCMTTMTRLIDEERSQLGIFTALGFSKNKIISKYLIYALLASLSGSLLGIVVGIALFPTVIYSAWHLMYNLPPMLSFLPFKVVLVGVVVFTSLMLMVTYLVARNSLKEMPAQLMRPKAPKNAKKVFLEKIPSLWKNLSFTSKITARNLIRYKSRFFMTVIGVAGCTGLLVAGFGIKDSISGIIEIQFKDIFDYTNTINLTDDEYLDDALKALNADSNNEQAVPFESYASKVYLVDGEEATINMQIFDDRQIDRVMNLRTLGDGRALDIHGDGVVVSEKFARNNNLEVGDELTIESSDGLKATVTIDGICEMYFQHYMFMSKVLYEDVFHKTSHPNAIAVKAIDSEAMKADLVDIPHVKSIVDFEPMIANFQNMLKALDFIILVIILSSGSLALVVLMNLSEVNISERIREIATIKVLGFNNREVDSYIFKEILLLTIIGALVGLPLGKLEHNLIMTVINMEMVMFGMRLNILSYLYAFLITMSFTVIVLLLMSRSLKKIKMVESLKSVE